MLPNATHIVSHIGSKMCTAIFF